jgi:hypothetical protein
MNASLAPPAPPPIPQKPAPVPQTTRQKIGGALGEALGGAADQWWKAKVAGYATKEFNDTAFPGTTPWEQLGEGAHGDAAIGAAAKSDELKQRERESERAQETALATTRMQAAQIIGTTLLEQGGDTNVQLVTKIWQQAGLLGAEFGTLPDAYSNTRLNTEIQDKLNQIQNRNDRLDLDRWVAEEAKSSWANEIRGISGVVGEAWELAKQKWKEYSSSDMSEDQIIDRIGDDLAKEVGEREAVAYVQWARSR